LDAAGKVRLGQLADSCAASAVRSAAPDRCRR
jgi:hypothetical protein